jgi:hypothetical protein
MEKLNSALQDVVIAHLVHALNVTQLFLSILALLLASLVDPTANLAQIPTQINVIVA